LNIFPRNGSSGTPDNSLAHGAAATSCFWPYKERVIVYTPGTHLHPLIIRSGCVFDMSNRTSGCHFVKGCTPQQRGNYVPKKALNQNISIFYINRQLFSHLVTNINMCNITNKSYDITEILFKVALNTIILTPRF
jgi:hypothetical protein